MPTKNDFVLRKCLGIARVVAITYKKRSGIGATTKYPDFIDSDRLYQYPYPRWIHQADGCTKICLSPERTSAA